MVSGDIYAAYMHCNAEAQKTSYLSRRTLLGLNASCSTLKISGSAFKVGTNCMRAAFKAHSLSSQAALKPAQSHLLQGSGFAKQSNRPFRSCCSTTSRGPFADLPFFKPLAPGLLEPGTLASWSIGTPRTDPRLATLELAYRSQYTPSCRHPAV